MMSATQQPIPLTSQQLAKIIQYGNAGKWPEMYRYVFDEVQANRIQGMPSAQVYWFEQAAKINSNDPNSAAAVFIRSSTRSGLIASGVKPTQSVINEISNEIGKLVYEDIINNSKIPPFTNQLNTDISAALQKGNISIGSWGGAFFYWNNQYFDKSVERYRTVGESILSNNIEKQKFVRSFSEALYETSQAIDAGWITKENGQAFITALKQGLSNFTTDQKSFLLMVAAMDRGMGLLGSPQILYDRKAPPILQDIKNEIQKLFSELGTGTSLEWKGASVQVASLENTQALGLLLDSNSVYNNQTQATAAQQSATDQINNFVTGKDIRGAQIELLGSFSAQSDKTPGIRVTLKNGESITVLATGEASTTRISTQQDGTRLFDIKSFDGTLTSISEHPRGDNIVKVFDANQQMLNRTVNEFKLDGSFQSTVFDANGKTLQTSVITTEDDDYSSKEVITSADGQKLERLTNQITGQVIERPVIDGSGNLQQTIRNTGDFLSLIQAIQSGKPLPALASGARLIGNVSGNTTFAAAGATLSAVNSLVGLSKALENGNVGAAVVSSANLVSYGVDALGHVYKGIGDTAIGQFANTLNTPLINGAPGATPLGLLNVAFSLSQKDYLGAAVNTVAMWYPAVGVVYMAAQIFVSLFKSDPEPWAVGRFVYNADGSLGTHVVGGDGGEPAVQGIMNNLRDAMQRIVNESNSADTSNSPERKVGLIAQRMGSIEYRGGRHIVNDLDPQTGQQRRLVYDEQLKLLSGAALGSDAYFKDMGTQYLMSSLEREAIAPLWEVQTAQLQQQRGDPQAGLTELQRAQRNSQMAGATAATATTINWRPVTLDLDGNGITKLAQTSAVAFNVNDEYTAGTGSASNARQGFVRRTEWVGPSDGFLVLYRNYNGVFESSAELFSNGKVSDGAKGVSSMKWVDGNVDGVISAADPVWSQLKVWRDANSDGQQQAANCSVWEHRKLAA
jgi:hypothetical protein